MGDDHGGHPQTALPPIPPPPPPPPPLPILSTPASSSARHPVLTSPRYHHNPNPFQPFHPLSIPSQPGIPDPAPAAATHYPNDPAFAHPAHPPPPNVRGPPPKDPIPAFDPASSFASAIPPPTTTAAAVDMPLSAAAPHLIGMPWFPLEALGITPATSSQPHAHRPPMPPHQQLQPNPRLFLPPFPPPTPTANMSASMPNLASQAYLDALIENVRRGESAAAAAAAQHRHDSKMMAAESTGSLADAVSTMGFEPRREAGRAPTTQQAWISAPSGLAAPPQPSTSPTSSFALSAMSMYHDATAVGKPPTDPSPRATSSPATSMAISPSPTTTAFAPPDAATFNVLLQPFGRDGGGDGGGAPPPPVVTAPPGFYESMASKTLELASQLMGRATPRVTPDTTATTMAPPPPDGDSAGDPRPVRRSSGAGVPAPGLVTPTASMPPPTPPTTCTTSHPPQQPSFAHAPQRFTGYPAAGAAGGWMGAPPARLTTTTGFTGPQPPTPPPPFGGAAGFAPFAGQGGWRGGSYDPGMSSGADDMDVGGVGAGDGGGGDDDAMAALKRRRNTEAARRSRQKKMMKMADLEGYVKRLEAQNTNLTLKVAVLENERGALTTRQTELVERVGMLETQLREAHRSLLAFNTSAAMAMARSSGGGAAPVRGDGASVGGASPGSENVGVRTAVEREGEGIEGERGEAKVGKGSV
ncbi:hypothetical protein HDU96_004183 [Phlyctochytrium bullatum]|nr:hypothetical protein HDU96_004183 [Phlyctochytrium bullatum]